MRYLIPALFVALFGCHTPATSTTSDAAENTRTTDTGNGGEDVSDATDGGPDQDDAAAPSGDMAADVASEDTNSDAAPDDSGLAGDAENVDLGPGDARARDTTTDDEDAPSFVCPPEDYNGEICTQVIVYVRDLESGECCEYPTACHIPEGNWSEMTYNSEAECGGI